MMEVWGEFDKTLPVSIGQGRARGRARGRAEAEETTDNQSANIQRGRTQAVQRVQWEDRLGIGCPGKDPSLGPWLWLLRAAGPLTAHQTRGDRGPGGNEGISVPPLPGSYQGLILCQRQGNGSTPVPGGWRWGFPYIREDWGQPCSYFLRQRGRPVQGNGGSNTMSLP